MVQRCVIDIISNYDVLYKLHQSLDLRPFVLHIFTLLPLVNLHHFLNYVFSFSINALWLVYLHLFMYFPSYGTINFDVYLSYLLPPFQEHNYSVKQGHNTVSARCDI